MKFSRFTTVMIVIASCIAMTLLWYLRSPHPTVTNTSVTASWASEPNGVSVIKQTNFNPFFSDLLREDLTDSAIYKNLPESMNRQEAKELASMAFIYRSLTSGTIDQDTTRYCELVLCPELRISSNVNTCKTFCNNFVDSIHRGDIVTCKKSVDNIGIKDQDYGMCDTLFLDDLQLVISGGLDERWSKQRRFSYAIRKKDQRVCDTFLPGSVNMPEYSKKAFCVFAVGK